MARAIKNLFGRLRIGRLRLMVARPIGIKVRRFGKVRMKIFVQIFFVCWFAHRQNFRTKHFVARAILVVIFSLHILYKI